MTEYQAPTPPYPRSQNPDGSDYDSTPSFLKIESRDYSKEPASLGEKIVGTAKIMAQPAAGVIKRAYDRFGK